MIREIAIGVMEHDKGPILYRGQQRSQLSIKCRNRGLRLCGVGGIGVGIARIGLRQCLGHQIGPKHGICRVKPRVWVHPIMVVTVVLRGLGMIIMPVVVMAMLIVPVVIVVTLFGIAKAAHKGAGRIQKGQACCAFRKAIQGPVQPRSHFRANPKDNIGIGKGCGLAGAQLERMCVGPPVQQEYRASNTIHHLRCQGVNRRQIGHDIRNLCQGRGRHTGQ